MTRLEISEKESFSPYSRGWSRYPEPGYPPADILPVFAGMVPVAVSLPHPAVYSPRIRGDGPKGEVGKAWKGIFSPYSRGWSQFPLALISGDLILPVFAGMVPGLPLSSARPSNSPRIRGDGPRLNRAHEDAQTFSPYSRGWSL